MQAIARPTDTKRTVASPSRGTAFSWARSWIAAPHARSLSKTLPIRLNRAFQDARGWVLDTPPQQVPRRFPFAAAIGLVLAAGAYGATLGGHWQAAGTWVSSRALETATVLGIAVDAVSFEGLAELQEADLLPVVLMTKGPADKPLDVAAVKAALLTNPWIAKAEVRRLFPNRLVVTIEERRPIALLQDHGLQLVDADGVHLGPLVGERFASLPVIAGKGAIEASAELKRLMRAAFWLPSKPRGAVRVGGRRWNLILQDGSMLRLPANNGAGALVRLKALDEAGTILTSALLAAQPVVIDLRFPDQVTFSRLDQPIAEDETEGLVDPEGAPS